MIGFNVAFRSFSGPAFARNPIRRSLFLSAPHPQISLHQRPEIAVQNTIHVANFEFPGGKQITWQGLSCNKHPDSSAFVTFYGDKGALALGMFGDYKVYNADDKLVEDRPDDAKGGRPWLAIDTYHAADFVAKIRSGDHFGVNAQIEKGHRSTLLCHLGNIAYRTGRALTFDDAAETFPVDPQATAMLTREYRSPFTMPEKV